MKAARARKRAELVTKLLESAGAGIRPDDEDIKQAEQLGIDTEAIMEVFLASSGDD